jgi:SET domain-containing protein
VSFRLKASLIHGVGVVALRPFAAGEELPLFDPDERILTSRLSPNTSEAELQRIYSVRAGDGLFSYPENLQRMSVGWYMNHSDAPNAAPDLSLEVYRATRDIAPGDEVTVDYRALGEEPPALDDGQDRRVR